MHAVVQPIFESLALFAWCLLACVVPAAESPSELKSLNVEQAQALVEDFQNQKLVLDGVTVLSDDVAEELAKHKGRLCLNGLTTLSIPAIESLASRQAGRSPTGLPVVGLELNGLESLSTDGAQALSRYKYSVALNGLKELSDDASIALAGTGGLLSLDGLTTLSDKAAEALSGHAAGLSLSGLTSLSDGAVFALAKHRHDLYLMGITRLSDNQAVALAKHKGENLQLTGLQEITPVGAAALATHKGATFNSPKAGPTESERVTATGIERGKAAVKAQLEVLENSIGMKLIRIPAGEFDMGSNDGEPDEAPVHRVRISKPFLLGMHEVTNAHWKRVMGNVPSKWKEDEQPVVFVSWEDAQEFCSKLSDLPEEQKAGRVYRLPTEAEWEYACRAGTTTAYSCGDSAAELQEYAWFRELGTPSDLKTFPVGKKKANPWGLYDMHGNVSEWCNDWAGSYGSQAVTDPQGPAKRYRRIIRGGDWYFDSSACRSSHRERDAPSLRVGIVGFRIAVSVGD